MPAGEPYRASPDAERRENLRAASHRNRFRGTPLNVVSRGDDLCRIDARNRLAAAIRPSGAPPIAAKRSAMRRPRCTTAWKKDGRPAAPGSRERLPAAHASAAALRRSGAARRCRPQRDARSDSPKRQRHRHRRRPRAGQDASGRDHRGAKATCAAARHRNAVPVPPRADVSGGVREPELRMCSRDPAQRFH